MNGVTAFNSLNDSNATKIGNGRKDTQLILASMVLFTGPTRSYYDTGAAEKASYEDWFLPSLGELSLLYQSIKNNYISSFRFGDKWFWSSSQVNKSFAWGIRLDNGQQIQISKENENNVIAIRAF